VPPFASAWAHANVMFEGRFWTSEAGVEPTFAANGLSATLTLDSMEFIGMTNAPQKQVARTANGQFGPGVSGNLSGNVHRSRHALNADTIRAMHLAFRRGGYKAIEKVMRNQPAVFLKLLVLLVPREMKLEHSGGVKAMTDEQLERSLELIKELIAKRDGENAKVIEGVAEPVPALPPPSRKARRKVRRSHRADSGLAARVVDAEPTDEVRQPPRGQVSPSKSP
jgi:hypothetical protein